VEAKQRIAIIGGGWFGLALGFELLERIERAPGSFEVVIFEARDSPGGPVRTDRQSGVLFEYGPSGVLDDRESTRTFLTRLGLSEKIVPAGVNLKRKFIYRNGRLRPLVPNPAVVLKGGLLPVTAIPRMALEPFVKPMKDEDDLTLRQWLTRRIGRSAADVLAPSIALGIYAGSADELSARAAYPKIVAMEREHGSLFRAMSALRKSPKPPARMLNFQGGMQTLTDAVVGRIDSCIRRNSPVAGIHPMGDRGVRLRLENGPPEDFEIAVLCAPAHAGAPMIREADSKLADALASIPYSPITLVHAVYPVHALPDMEGFGFLAPPGGDLGAIACVWASSLFRDRTPKNQCLTSWMYGGRTNPERAAEDDTTLLKRVRADLQKTLGVDLSPSQTRIMRWPRAVPQYTTSHRGTLKTIETALQAHPRLRIFGNATHGVGIADGMQGAGPQAEELLDSLG
jgi:oxygen-dependent protoporphyrinogen oxidase